MMEVEVEVDVETEVEVVVEVEVEVGLGVLKDIDQEQIGTSIRVIKFFKLELEQEVVLRRKYIMEIH